MTEVPYDSPLPRSISQAVSCRTAGPGDAFAIAEIYNQAVKSRLATFETTLRTPLDRREWLIEHGAQYPIVVAEFAGSVVGWASIAPFSPRQCYRGIGYFSIYVEEDMRGRGVGRVLLPFLVHEAARRGYWKLLSGIFAGNAASRSLCAACGFREVGVYQRHAQLDDRWIDVVMVERSLSTSEG